MKQPSAPNSSPPPPSSSSTAKKPRLPSPEEVLAHYESKGLDTRAAALNAVEDLQTLLHKTFLASKKGPDKLNARIDNINARLSLLEAKIDSKPGVPECLAIGLASGALLGGLGSVVPHVVGGISSVWGSVRSVTRSSPPSS